MKRAGLGGVPGQNREGGGVGLELAGSEGQGWPRRAAGQQCRQQISALSVLPGIEAPAASRHHAVPLCLTGECLISH